MLSGKELFEIITKYGVHPGGFIPGKYLFAKNDNRFKLVRYDSQEYHQIIRESD